MGIAMTFARVPGPGNLRTLRSAVMSEERKPNRVLLLSIYGMCMVAGAIVGTVVVGDFGFEGSGFIFGAMAGMVVADWINSIIWKKRWAAGGSTDEMTNFAFEIEKGRAFYRSIFDKRGVNKPLDLLLYVFYTALLIPIIYTTFVVANEIAALKLPIAPELFTAWFVDPLAQVVPAFDRHATELRVSGHADHIGAVRVAYGVSWLFGPIAIFSGSVRLIAGRQQLLANLRPGMAVRVLLVLGIVILPVLSYVFFSGLMNFVENGSYSSFSLFWAPGMMVGIAYFALLYVAYFTGRLVKNSAGGSFRAET